MRVVIDASVAAKWVLPEDREDAAKALLSDDPTAPGLWLLEVGNAIWKRVQRGEFPAAEGDDLLAILAAAPVRTTPVETDIGAALSLANALKHPIYDCLYLAAAIREDTVVVTDDARFVRAVAGTEHEARVKRLGA